MSDVGAALCHRGSKHLHQRRLSRATPDLAYQGVSHRGSAIEVPKGTGQELPIGGGRKAPIPDLPALALERGASTQTGH
jgi:hypothetical protein